MGEDSGIPDEEKARGNSVIRKLLPIVLLLCGLASAQVPVILATPPKLQFFDSSGRTLSFGCVFTYQTGTTTPLATYTDSTGVIQNANPVVLNAGGFANIWIQAGLGYTFKVVSAGGVNCVSGTTLYTINGIGGGTTLNTTVVTYSATPLFPIVAQNQLFKITLTGNASAQPLTATGIVPPAWIAFQITQDVVGGHTFSWPANSVGGAPIGLNANQVTTQMFLWNGTIAEAVGPGMEGNGPIVSVGSLIASGSGTFGGALGAASLNITGTGVFGTSVTSPAFISATSTPAASGIVRLANIDAICWRNVASSADECFSVDASDRLLASFAGGLTLTGAQPYVRLGGTTASFPMLKPLGTTVAARLADDSADAPLSASTLTYNGNVTIAGACSTGQVETATSSTAVSCQNFESVQASSITTNTGTAIGASATTWVTKAVTMPSTGCPCRAFVSYGVAYSSAGSGGAVFWVEDGTSQFGMSQTVTATSSGVAPGASASSFSPNTYGNSASVTFTGRGYTNAGAGITTAAPAFGSTQNPWLNVAIFTSN
jgi:hypothetical protein